LWIEANHDGISQPEELYTLPSLGVNSISLKYTEDRKTDQYGNQFRYMARLNPDKATDVGKTAYDVFFVGLPPKQANKCTANLMKFRESMTPKHSESMGPRSSMRYDFLARETVPGTSPSERPGSGKS
jgi:hypothetical protein